MHYSYKSQLKLNNDENLSVTLEKIIKIINNIKLIPSINQICPIKAELTIGFNHFYERWLIHCYLPFFCKSLTFYVPSEIFGYNFLMYTLQFIKSCLQKLNGSKFLKLSDQNMYISFIGRLSQYIMDNFMYNTSKVYEHDLEQEIKIVDEPLKSPLHKVNKKIKLEVNSSSNTDSPLSKYSEFDKSFIANTVNEVCLKLGPENDSVASCEERKGIIHFRLLHNNLDQSFSIDDLYQLYSFNHLLSTQLPKMPRSYITRIVFDPHHRNLLLYKNNSVIGGICFRPFVNQGFSEIVFCAISSEHQVKGYGTYIMNQLKDIHIHFGILDLLTYADELAIGYFKKQGFYNDIKLSKSIYEGFIKSYDSATLMNSRLNPNICYKHINLLLKQQLEVLKELTWKKQSIMNIKRPGLDFFKNGLTKIPIDSIPGIELCSSDAIKLRANNYEVIIGPKFQNSLASIIKSLRSHPSAWPFLKPVSSEEVPDYYEIIKFPSDLKTISEKQKNGEYENFRMFYADIERMFKNCTFYNGPDSEYTRCSNALRRFFSSKINEYFNLDI